MAKHWNIQWSKGKQNTTDAFYIRGLVFMVEQGFQDEFDDLDEKSWHVIVYDHGEPVGTGRTYEENGVWHIGRICVLENYRGKGVGRLIVENLEQKVKELKGTTVELSAQVQAEGFYKRNGYTPYGEVYQDEHCPHIAMRKEL